MAEIKNYTPNSGFGRALRVLDFAGAKSSTEIERGRFTALVSSSWQR